MASNYIMLPLRRFGVTKIFRYSVQSYIYLHELYFIISNMFIKPKSLDSLQFKTLNFIAAILPLMFSGFTVRSNLRFCNLDMPHH